MTEKNQNAESDQPSVGTIENEKYLNQPSGGMIENEKYLDRALLEYCNSDAYPFHMPGHKRQTMGNWNCEAIDITEITGFDNLHHAEGILLEAQQRAAQTFGADESFFLVNGSTAGLLAAVCGTVKKGGRLKPSALCLLGAAYASSARSSQMTPMSMALYRPVFSLFLRMRSFMRSSGSVDMSCTCTLSAMVISPTVLVERI